MITDPMCPECGRFPRSDEDGCCATCGRDIVFIPARIEPSQARYRSAVALHRLATALGIQLRAEEEDCLCLERLASQAERWRRFDERAPDGEGTREKAYAAGYGSDVALRGEGEPDLSARIDRAVSALTDIVQRSEAVLRGKP